jgi:hypothetical protein
MSKKIKISESQLKMIMERKHSYIQQTNEEEFETFDQLKDENQEKIEVEEEKEEVVNESIEKIKSEFKRFL